MVTQDRAAFANRLPSRCFGPQYKTYSSPGLHSKTYWPSQNLSQNIILQSCTRREEFDQTGQHNHALLNATFPVSGKSFHFCAMMNTIHTSSSVRKCSSLLAAHRHWENWTELSHVTLCLLVLLFLIKHYLQLYVSSVNICYSCVIPDKLTLYALWYSQCLLYISTDLREAILKLLVAIVFFVATGIVTPVMLIAAFCHWRNANVKLRSKL